MCPARPTITATAGANGSITPSGAVAVNYGADQSFTIAADVNYHIADVLVDAVSVGAVSSYTFTNVTAAHTIAASFAIDTYTITASAVTLRRVMFGSPPIDASIRADLHALVRHPPRIEARSERPG